jgi:metal transporter CNNM
MNYFLLALEITGLVSLSAIYSGLNIGLMSLSKADLRRKAKLGDSDAMRVLPYRENSHLSLAAILFANVAVISASSLILEHHFNGLIAGVVSTILIVIFGEVLPQAWFVRFALKFCGFFIPLLQMTIALTYVISKPLQLVLDRLITQESQNLHSRDELGMLIGEHQLDVESELDEDEVEIIKSTLQLSEKQVRDIMQPIENVFWLEYDAILDAKTVDLITSRAYSRVPVFNKDLTDCFGVLLMKDMVDIDFDEHPQPVRSFTLHRTKMIGSRTALDTMLRKFFTIRTHLVPIEKDDRVIGILTVEDLIEAIIGHEIADETDHKLERM